METGGERDHCNMALKSGVMLSGRAAMEPDGVRLTYLAKDHTDLDFEEFQAPTCVKLYSEFYDLFLERTHIHTLGHREIHADPLARSERRVSRFAALGCSLIFDYSFFPDSLSCRFSFFRAALACLISSLACCSALFTSLLASASGRRSWTAFPSETGSSPDIFDFN